MSESWRVGRKVPVNVYVGDTIAGQFQKMNHDSKLIIELKRQIETMQAEIIKLHKRIRELESQLPDPLEDERV